tara:strand:+ start:278 stop:1216 length:939 start_codon:yes stop_codon:yes gene_type:complete
MNRTLKKIVIFVLLNLFIVEECFSLNNSIVFTIDDKIITKIDIQNEINYLKALNPNINELKKEKIYTIGKNSLLREKIKELEIYKYIDELSIDEDYLNILIKGRYEKLNFLNKEEFLTYLENYNINIKDIEKKLSIEATWNQLIYSKFFENVKIDKEKLKEKIIKNNKKGINSYLISEILFNVNNKNDLEIKYNEIVKSINNNGFENAALTFSESDTSSIGGKIGWINENSLNNEIKSKLSKLKIKEITDPIFTPSGYLILKLNDKKITKKNYDLNKQLGKAIKFETNRQLNQISNNYYKKIKNNYEINEIQ